MVDERQAARRDRDFDKAGICGKAKDASNSWTCAVQSMNPGPCRQIA